jgi:lysophospholipase L1-like esterase
MNKKGFSLIPIIVIIIVLVIGGIAIFKLLPKDKIPSNISPPKLTNTSGEERKLIALGASISKANNLSTSLTGDYPEYSFATGTKINSLYLYLKNKGENLIAVNLAESGADSRRVFESQVTSAVGYYPKYVTIDVTADILTDSSPQKLVSNLAGIVGQLKREDTVILVGSYPNFPKMRSASYPSCKEDKLKVGFDKVTNEKILAFNKAIADFARENKVIFVNIYDTLGPEDVSDYDCVHPNIEGQKKLAKTWIEALK